MDEAPELSKSSESIMMRTSHKTLFWVSAALIVLLLAAYSYMNSFHFFMIMSREKKFSAVAGWFPMTRVRMHVNRMTEDKSLSVDDLHAVIVALDDSYDDLRDFEPGITQLLGSDIRLINLTGHLYVSRKLDPFLKKRELLELLMQDDETLDWASRAKIGEVLIECYEVSSNEISAIRVRQREIVRARASEGRAIEVDDRE